MDRRKLYIYLLDNEIPVTEDMDIGTMLDLLVDDYINNIKNNLILNNICKKIKKMYIKSMGVRLMIAKEIKEVINLEKKRQNSTIELIASENYASKEVRKLMFWL